MTELVGHRNHSDTVTQASKRHQMFCQGCGQAIEKMHVLVKRDVSFPAEEGPVRSMIRESYIQFDGVDREYSRIRGHFFCFWLAGVVGGSKFSVLPNLPLIMWAIGDAVFATARRRGGKMLWPEKGFTTGVGRYDERINHFKDVSLASIPAPWLRTFRAWADAERRPEANVRESARGPIESWMWSEKYKLRSDRFLAPAFSLSDWMETFARPELCEALRTCGRELPEPQPRVRIVGKSARVKAPRVPPNGPRMIPIGGSPLLEAEVPLRVLPRIGDVGGRPATPCPEEVKYRLNEPLRRLAREYGFNRTTLRRWRREYGFEPTEKTG